MNIAAMRLLPAEDGISPPLDSDIARIVVFESMEDAEDAWRALEDGDTLSTPYQRYDFLKCWQAHVGAAADVTPSIVVGFNAADVPLFLLPLGSRRIGSMTALEFLGGKHANFNMALWHRHFAVRASTTALAIVLKRLKGRADLLALVNQPLTWSGMTNPLALLPRQHSANFGFSGALAADFDALLRAHTNSATRKKMRKKERALAELGTVRFKRVQCPNEIRRVLDAFFKQKSARMRDIGVPDVFAEPGVRRFIEAAAIDRPANGEPVIELYALTVDDIIVATMGGIVGGGRFCAMFNSILSGRHAAQSPGEQLLIHLVRQCCERGLTTFDLGIGQSRYKNLFCHDAEPLFDSYLPLSPAGRLLALAYQACATAKRAVKQHPALWALVRSTRRLRARLRPKL